MTFNTSDLRAFISAAGRLKTNTIIPVLSFIRFQDGTITKNNLREFVQYSTEFTGEFLVEERILSNFIAATKAEQIEVTWTGKKVLLSDGKTKVSSPNEALTNYPVNELPVEAAFNLSTDACSAIGVASQMLSDKEDAHPRTKHVFIGNKMIAGVDGWTAYVQDFMDDLPQIMLAQAPARLVARLDGARFSENESYHFFQSGQFLYGFIKPECAWMDMGILKRKATFPAFSIDKGELIRFCEICLSENPLDGIVAMMEKSGDLKLQMSDQGYNVDVNTSLPVEGEDAAPFKFQPKLMLRLLKALPAQEVKAWRGSSCYYFTADNFESSLQIII